MRNPLGRFMRVLADATGADLRRQVHYLKAENQILRSKLPRVVRTTAAERSRLVKLGKPLLGEGRSIRELMTIVRPETFVRWVNQEGKSRRRFPPSSHKARVGRPPSLAQHVRELILRLAQESDWGYMRICGELRKLGITVATSTIVNVLKEHGIPTGPQRAEGTWDKFIRTHAQTLWACDFVSQKVWTKRGLVLAFVLVFIHLKSRRVIMSPSTTRPDRAWVREQAVAFARTVRGNTETAGDEHAREQLFLLRDKDTKYAGKDGGRHGFDGPLREAGITALPLPPRSPNLNAYAERFIKTLRHECLDRFIVMGTKHLDHLVGEFTDYYNRQRPHSRIGFSAPTGPPPPPPPLPSLPAERRAATPSAREIAQVECQERLGGVVRHYFRRAA